MAVSMRSRTRSPDSGTSTPDARAQKRCRKRKRPASQSPQRSPSPSCPLSTLSDLPNELLHQILAELPRSVETIITLATTCRRLNEFAMAYHFGSDFYLSFGGHSQPFASFRMLRLSFIHKPRLSFIHCMFSDNFDKEMTEVQRSLAVLKAMGTKFHVSFEGMDWPEIPAEKHVAFFEDLSKLKCHAIDTKNAGSRLAVPPTANDIIKFDPPAFTQLSKVTLSQLPECYVAWMLRSINQSPITALCLHSLSDDNLLELNKLSLHHLQDVTLVGCTFRFAAVAAFLESHWHITFLNTRTWNPISSITGSKGRRRSSRGLKRSLEPATRMLLSSITGTATVIRALLSTPEAFPSLERVDVTDGDVTGMQEALLSISHIPTVHHLYLRLQDLNEWLQFKFPRGKGVERAEPLLTMITDLTIHEISFANIPAVAGLIPNLKRFHISSTFLNVKEKDILGFVRRMKDACPGLETVRVNWCDFFTNPKWLQQKRKELDERGR